MSREFVTRVSSQAMYEEDFREREGDTTRVLQTLGISINVSLDNHGQQCPLWFNTFDQCDHRHGRKYTALLRATNGREPLRFSFWNSYWNHQHNITLVGRMTVLAVITNTLSEYYRDYNGLLGSGLREDSTLSRSIWRNHLSFKRKVREWLTENELQVIRGIA